ncbi:thioredoxin domain-containing protein [Candidatus Wolfebacteria bacterium]|nr:thioredoxin domain-containing protein [Candidatus Wolfebacteria bacterium]
MAKYAIPGAIVVAGLLIAGAVFFGTGDTPNNTNQQEQADASVVLPVLESDHILGNPNAKIIIIEYSDIDCPFCKQFHVTMKQIMEEYGQTGEVAWVYRHFPLTSLHPDAVGHAEAAECVAELGGNDSFWNFLDILFENAPGNERTDPSRYGEFAELVGVSKTSLDACVASGKYTDKIKDSFNTAIEAGGTGTPFNIIVVEGQEPVAFSSALPYEQMKTVIEQILSSQ